MASYFPTLMNNSKSKGFLRNEEQQIHVVYALRAYFAFALIALGSFGFGVQGPLNLSPKL